MTRINSFRQAGRMVWQVAAAILLSVVCTSANAAPTPALWATGFFSNSVNRYDPVTGAPLTTVSGTGLSGATGIDLGLDGNIYVNNHYGHAVQRYDAQTGAFIDTFINSGLQHPDGLLFDGNTLYVADYSNARVATFDATSGAPTGGYPIADPVGLAMGGDGFLYVGSVGPRPVRRIELSTGTVSNFTDPISNPYTLNFGPDGNLYVRDDISILRFDSSTGAFIDTFASGLDNPNDPTFGPDGNLYVANRADDSIRRFDGATGSFMDVFVQPGAGGLDHPTYLLFTVPEPSSAIGLGLGAAALLARRRRGL